VKYATPYDNAEDREAYAYVTAEINGGLFKMDTIMNRQYTRVLNSFYRTRLIVDTNKLLANYRTIVGRSVVFRGGNVEAHTDNNRQWHHHDTAYLRVQSPLLQKAFKGMALKPDVANAWFKDPDNPTLAAAFIEAIGGEDAAFVLNGKPVDPEDPVAIEGWKKAALDGKAPPKEASLPQNSSS